MKDDGASEPRGHDSKTAHRGHGKWFEMCGKIHKNGGKFIRVCDHCSYTNPASAKVCVLCEKRIGVANG